jgi:hypothetical protein
VKFTDPRSGFTYVARLYGPDTVDGKAIDAGVASRMLIHANDLLALAYDVELDADKKPVLDEFGRPTLTLDASGQPIPKDNQITTTGFADYVGLLDANVEVARRISHGAGVILDPTANGF